MGTPKYINTSNLLRGLSTGKIGVISTLNLQVRMKEGLIACPTTRDSTRHSPRALSPPGAYMCVCVYFRLQFFARQGAWPLVAQHNVP